MACKIQTIVDKAKSLIEKYGENRLVKVKDGNFLSICSPMIIFYCSAQEELAKLDIDQETITGTVDQFPHLEEQIDYALKA